MENSKLTEAQIHFNTIISNEFPDGFIGKTQAQMDALKLNILLKKFFTIAEKYEKAVQEEKKLAYDNLANIISTVVSRSKMSARERMKLLKTIKEYKHE